MKNLLLLPLLYFLTACGWDVTRAVVAQEVIVSPCCEKQSRSENTPIDVTATRVKFYR